MKPVYSLVIALIFFSSAVKAQDEGEVVVKERFARDKSVYISVGPSFTIGKNLGDYSTGLSLEAGFLKKSNKLISWGANLSYLKFGYDESQTYKYFYDPENDFAIESYLDGGDISLLSVGFNLKLNFIPVGDNTAVSIYGIVNPFVSFVKRTEVTSYAELFVDEDEFEEYDGIYDTRTGDVTFDAEDYPALASESKVSGGAHLGFGVEFVPSHAVSFFLQATFCYTLPVSYVATDSFLKEEDQYVDEEGTIYYIL
jgi:hypothetical protein